MKFILLLTFTLLKLNFTLALNASDTTVVDLGLCQLGKTDSVELNISKFANKNLEYFFHSQNFNYWIFLRNSNKMNNQYSFNFQIYYTPKSRQGVYSDTIYLNFHEGKQLMRHVLVIKSNVVEVRQSYLKSLNVMNMNIPSVLFDSMMIQLDTFLEGQSMKVKLRLRNADTLPIILSVERICSCEAPSWTVDPILPGNYGLVQLTSNTNGKAGQYNRILSIKVNNVIFHVSISYFVKPKS